MRRLWLRAKALLRPARFERELDDELQFHLAMRARDHRAAGLPDEEAWRRARQDFGRLPSIKDSTRDVWSVRQLDGLWQDLRYAVRALAASRGFTAVAVLTLAIGIGANSAIFSLIEAVWLTPLQAPQADRLVRFETLNGAGASEITSAQQFEYWQSQADVFDAVAAHRLEFANLTGGDAPEHIPVARISAGFFDVFGVAMARGRPFTVAEDRPGGPAVAVVSFGLWTRWFGQADDVLGKTIVLGGRPHTIVGVAAPSVDTEQFDARPDVWIPFQYDGRRVDAGDLSVVTGRLKAGISLDAARARVQAADAAFPAYRARVTGQPGAADAPRSDLRPLLDAMVGDMRGTLVLLAAAVGLVLLIACANVSTLLLARGSARRRELAVRAALGASRWRLVRQLFVEALVLSAAGGAAGVLLGAVTMRAVLRLFPAVNPMLLGANPAGLPRLVGGSAPSLDWRVLAFTTALCIAASLLFGLLPALRAAGRDLAGSLPRATFGFSLAMRPGRARGALVVLEMAAAVVLLVGASLLIRTVRAYVAVDTGFDPRGVVTMRMAIGGTPYATADGIARLTEDGLARVRAIPGVVSASTACCMPLETVWQLPFVLQSRSADGLTRRGNLAFHGFGGWTFVSPGYFDTLGIRVLRGRDFTDADAFGAPGVAIINEMMARRYWPDADPLTDRLAIGRGMRPEDDADPIRQIVGIVADVRTQGLARRPRPEMYVPVAQVPSGVTALNVTLLPIVWLAKAGDTADAPRLAALVAQALEQASGLAVARVRTMDEVVAESTGRTRFEMWLLTLFGAAALLLAAIGVYGLTSHSVHARTHEIGIRLALGASPARVRNGLLGQGLALAAAGTAIGLAAALALMRLMAGLLFGVTPRDPLSFAGVAAVLVGVAAVAVWLPARRATGIDPVQALRSE